MCWVGVEKRGRGGDIPCTVSDDPDVVGLTAEADQGFVLGVAELDEVLADALARGREREAAAAVSLTVILAAARGGSRPGAGGLFSRVSVGALCVRGPLLDHPDVEDAGRHEAHYGYERPPWVLC